MWIDNFYYELPNFLPRLNFVSFYYVFFCFLVFMLSRSFKNYLRPYILLVANILFLYTFGLNNLIFIFVCFVYVYGVSFLVSKRKNYIVYLSIVPIVLLLVFFKYYNLLDTKSNFIIPLGMSFYLFKAMSYLFDINKGICDTEKNPIYVFDYLSFFPTIIAGPINRFKPFVEEIKSYKFLDYKSAKEGGFQLFLGILEKIVICDYVANIVNNISLNKELAGFYTLLMVFLYSVQIYLDFDSLSNIAIGTSRLLGFNLPKNFNSPYLAKNLKEFWRRWHISLSSWFKDYLYIPLGGSKKGRAIKYLNVVIVFLVSGMWHGNTVNFIIWGLLHGIIQVVEDLFFGLFRNFKFNFFIKKFLGFIGIIFNFVLVTFIWLFFRYETLDEVKNVLFKFFEKRKFDFVTLNMTNNEVIWLVAILFFTLILDILRSKFNMLEKFSKLFFPIRWVIYACLIYIFLVFGVYGGSFDASDFIYRWF